MTATSALMTAGALCGCISVDTQCETTTTFIEGRISRSTRCSAGLELLMFETAPAVEADHVEPAPAEPGPLP